MKPEPVEVARAVKMWQRQNPPQTVRALSPATVLALAELLGTGKE